MPPLPNHVEGATCMPPTKLYLSFFTPSTQILKETLLMMSYSVNTPE